MTGISSLSMQTTGFWLVIHYTPSIAVLTSGKFGLVMFRITNFPIWYWRQMYSGHFGQSLIPTLCIEAIICIFHCINVGNVIMECDVRVVLQFVYLLLVSRFFPLQIPVFAKVISKPLLIMANTFILADHRVVFAIHRSFEAFAI